jgi:hypothetical protein
MEPRSPDAILREWRERERELAATPNADLEALHARIVALRDEHTRAIEARRPQAEELRGPKP